MRIEHKTYGDKFYQKILIAWFVCSLSSGVILDLENFFELRKALPIVDVRAESEWESGHIPKSVNIPLLSDSERTIVGTAYKKEGQKQAIREGFRLVGPRLGEIVATAEQIGNEFIVHCWRGGMRSANFCHFVNMIGIRTHQLKGGYKAYRTAALRLFETPLNLVLITGLTGSGKSELLRALQTRGEQVVDLESLASHKGSAFGGLTMPPQPTTEQFENNLFELLNSFDRTRRIWLEDESIAIGKIFLPPTLWRQMSHAPVVELNVPRELRVQRLASEYAGVSQELFHDALKGITRRLGGQHYNAARDKLFAGDYAGSIDIILNYYDKAYANSIAKKQTRIVQKFDWNGKDVSQLAGILASGALSSHNGISV